MTWTLDPAQREILDAADRFARRELYPLAARMDAEEWWPDGVMARLAAAGLVGITIPGELGGVGADLFASGLVLQALARHNHAIALSWVAHENLCLNNIHRHATADQARRLVPALCAGTWVGGLALTEPGAGSDALGSMRTTARRDGDDYVLNGQKLYITNGPIADVLLVYAKTDPDRGAKGISAFIVEKPAFIVAQKLTKMGFRGSQTAEIVFEDARVPAANLLGEENRGVGIVMSGLDLERAMVSPICLGIAERALELAVAHARQREQFGRPIASFQMVQAKLAEIYVRVETMRAFTYRVLAACNALDASAGGRGEIHALTAASVLYAAEAMNRVLDDAVQVHGGSGYIWDTEINRLFRATKLLEIGAGTSEVRKLIISEELLAMTAPTVSPADRPLPFAPDLLRGQTAIVTGAAGGIGREIAHLAARLGARVVLAGRTPAKLDALAGELAAFPVAVHAVDVRERDAVDALYAAQPCDLVIHAAGGQFPQPAIDFTTKGFRAVIATNLEGTFHVMQAAARAWRDAGRGGSLVNVVVSPRGLHHVSHTVAARAGVRAFSEAVAVEWAPLGIRVNCVAPGAIETAGWAAYAPEVAARYPSSNPLRRAGTAWDIATACIFLAGPTAGFITGETLEVSGGGHLWGETWTTAKPAWFRAASRAFDPDPGQEAP